MKCRKDFLLSFQQKHELLWLREQNQDFQKKELLLYLYFKNSEKGVAPFTKEISFVYLWVDDIRCNI